MALLKKLCITTLKQLKFSKISLSHIVDSFFCFGEVFYKNNNFISNF